MKFKKNSKRNKEMFHLKKEKAALNLVVVSGFQNIQNII
jgi:hypothetical protein